MKAACAIRHLAADAELALQVAAAALGGGLADLPVLVQAYAAEALLIVHPDLAPEQALVWVGGRLTDARAIARTMSDPVWDQRIADRIAGAILYRSVATDLKEIERNTQDVVRRLRPRTLHLRPARAGRRIIEAQAPAANVTALLMGDPIPGRSALDQRRVSP